jgi:alpha-L-fucosidase 2
MIDVKHVLNLQKFKTLYTCTAFPPICGVYVKLMPDIKGYLKQHDLVYEMSPVEWNCGIPLANGEVGALIWGDGNPLKITLDKYDVWELRTDTPKDPCYNYAGLRKLIKEKRFDEARRVFMDLARFSGIIEEPYPTRIPLPRAELHFTDKVEKFTARLHLYDAFASGSLSSRKGRVRWRCFVHSRRNLITVELQYLGKIRLKDVKISLNHLDAKATETLKKWGYPDPIYDSKNGYKWIIQKFPAENAAGGGYVVAWRLLEKGRGEVIYISVLSFNDSSTPLESAIKIIDEAVNTDIETLLDSHRDFWRDFWSKSFIAIPDSRLENLFYVELYKLACCSMGRYPCSLQGLWSQDGVLPPWSGDYHLDMNIEETYWPIYASNHLELGKPLYEQFWKNLPKFKQMCHEFFGFDGAWSRCEMALDGTPIYGYWTTNFWPGNGAWLAHMYWLHWLYSQDENFLRERAYPMMKEFMKTYLNLLELWGDGRYHIPLSNSPEWEENRPEAWGSDTTCDLAFIRWLASSLLETSKILDIEDPDSVRWRDVLEKLSDYPKDEDGLQIFRGQPLTHSHRHQSHLIPVHPLSILNVEGSEEDRRLIYRSIETLLLRGTGEWTGWSFPWASIIASRARLPNMAWHMLQMYFFFIKPNSFHVNGDYRRFGVCIFTYQPMTLEAGFCAATAIMEMLLQSWNRRIRVFPAVPEFWKDVYFHNLRAEGAFLVTSKLKDRVVEYVIIRSEAGKICEVVNPFGENEISLINLKTGEERILSGKVLKFETRKGDAYLLKPSSKPLSETDLSYNIFERTLNERNWFGCKKIPRF